jgi:hypothetical protein
MVSCAQAIVLSRQALNISFLNFHRNGLLNQLHGDYKPRSASGAHIRSFHTGQWSTHDSHKVARCEA